MKPPPVPAPVNKKARVPAKAAPAVASSTSAPSSPAGKSAATGASIRPAVIRSSTSDKPSDVNDLANGVKKITLKAPASKEEHERKQTEKLNADRRARALKGAETRRVNAAAKKAAQSFAQSSGTNAIHKASPTVAPAPTVTSLPAVPAESTNSESPLVETPVSISAKENIAPLLLLDNKAIFEYPATVQHDVVRRSASNEVSQLQATAPAPAEQAGSPLPGDENTFASAAAAIPETSSPAYSVINLDGGPGNTAVGAKSGSMPTVPSKLAKRSQLPIFNSTGYIPFSTASAPQQGPAVVQTSTPDQQTQYRHEEQQEKSIWDVPESPAR
ncbi:hypothetical protein BST61_g3459 [Cercospora zeina]